VITPDEAARWADIKKTFQRNQITRGAGQDDPVSRVVGQLAAFQTGLEAIGQTLQSGLSREPAPVQLDLAPVERSLGAIESALQKQAAQPAAAAPAPQVTVDLAPVSRGLEALRKAVVEQLRGTSEPAAGTGAAGGALSAQLSEGL